MIKFDFLKILLSLLIAIGISEPDLRAQMASGQDKFVGNVFGNTVPVNYNSYWNQITPENSGKWGTVEGVRDTMNWSALDIAYDHAQVHGFPFKQHALVWGMQEPGWIGALSPAEQAAEVEEWIQAYAQRYPNTDMVDVVNEPLHVIPSFSDAIGGSGSTGWDWVIWSFEKARQYMPNAVLILNDYGILANRKNTRDYLTIINLLKDRNLIDGIGLQAHGLEYAQNSAIQSSLDDLAATGVPIYISELDLEFADDADQLNRFQSLFPLLYEHPGVVGVTLWGYIAGQHWKPDAYLLGQDNTLASYNLTTAFQDYTASGSGEIQVHLTNDNVNNANDIEADYVILDGTTYQSEDMEINTGVYQDNSCGGSFSQWMHCDGYIQFPAATQNITVRARGTTGSEIMEVHAVDMSVERPALQWLRETYFGSTNSLPVASFSSTVNGLSVDFDGSGSSDSDGVISAWSWDFGDGSTGTGEFVSHTYATSGNYTVTLTVTDDAGGTATDIQEVTVSDGNAVPVASFTFNSNLLAVDFDGSSSSDSDGSIASWSWDFGDGSSATGSLVSHSYASSGTYTVTLTVVDNAGATDAEVQSVTVSDGSGPVSLHVQSIITYTLGSGQGSKKGVAEVVVHDDQENPVSGATVTGTFSGTFSETVSAQTGADGTAVLTTTGSAKGSVMVDLCVDNVSHSLSYNSAANDITCTGSGARTLADTVVPEAHMSIFPNPAVGGQFTISLSGPTGEDLEVSIFNIHGKQVYHSVHEHSGEAIAISVPVKPGLYLLRVNNSSSEYQSRLIIK